VASVARGAASRRRQFGASCLAGHLIRTLRRWAVSSRLLDQLGGGPDPGCSLSDAGSVGWVLLAERREVRLSQRSRPPAPPASSTGRRHQGPHAEPLLGVVLLEPLHLGEPQLRRETHRPAVCGLGAEHHRARWEAHWRTSRGPLRTPRRATGPSSVMAGNVAMDLTLVLRRTGAGRAKPSCASFHKPLPRKRGRSCRSDPASGLPDPRTPLRVRGASIYLVAR